MRYRVTRMPHGFEVVYNDRRAEIIPDHTIISYIPTGIAGVFSEIAGPSYLTVSENTTKEQLLNALANEVA